MALSVCFNTCGFSLSNISTKLPLSTIYNISIFWCLWSLLSCCLGNWTVSATIAIFISLWMSSFLMSRGFALQNFSFELWIISLLLSSVKPHSYAPLVHNGSSIAAFFDVKYKLADYIGSAINRSTLPLYAVYWRPEKLSLVNTCLRRKAKFGFENFKSLRIRKLLFPLFKAVIPITCWRTFPVTPTVRDFSPVKHIY